MPGINRARCRKAAAECIGLARITADPDTKQILLTRGQEWLKLAYSEHDAEFEHLLADFNKEQMGLRAGAGPAMQRVAMQQQPMQQQQSKTQDKP